MALKAENVSKRYFRASGTSNYFLAVQPTDVEIPGGSLTVLLGRSGSGKTTLLNILSGLLTPTTGKVFLNDIDLYALPDEALAPVRGRRMGVIPQGRAALDTLTVMENILLPGLLYGNAGAKRQKTADGVLDKTHDEQNRAELLLERLGIGHLRGAMPCELSGGELRRMSIARALVRQPDAILADEPTGDLDDESTRTVLGLLREAANGGAAVLLVTHETDALQYADTAFRLNNGELLPMDMKIESD